MRNYLTLLSATCGLLFCSCTQNTAEPDPVLSVGSTELLFDASGSAAQTVEVTANVEWTADPSGTASEWLTVNKTDDKTITVTVKDNSVPQDRNGKIIVSATSAKVKSKEITVKQKGVEKGEMSLTVSPESLSFAGDDAPAREITVTVQGEGLTWTAAPDNEVSWLHLQVSKEKITVTVDNNPLETPRAVGIVVTPSDKEVETKIVKVVQEGKILLPSLTVEPQDDIRFTADDLWQHDVKVHAVKTKWSAVTADEEGNTVPWIILDVRNIDEESFVRVSAQKNTTLEERFGYVIIKPSDENIESVTISVSQEAGKEYITTLTEDVEITDMALTQGHNEMQFFPNSPGDDQPYIPNPEDPNTTYPGRMSAKWDLFIWGDGLTYDTNGWPFIYKGSGNRMKLNIRSERILYDPSGEYYLPDGEYTVALNEDELPNTVTYGQKDAHSDEIFPRGSWYFRVENDVTTAAAPIHGGKLTVRRDGDQYTLTFDFVDDAGNRITGSSKAVLNLQVMYFEPDDDDPVGGGGGEV